MTGGMYLFVHKQIDVQIAVSDVTATNAFFCTVYPKLRINLALIAHHAQYQHRMDLKFYPTLNKLKTLLLNEYWCEPPDFSALVSLLEHSPVLEKLTLQLYSEGPKHNVEIELSCKQMEKSAVISEHLSIVEIKCETTSDERVSSVLKFLGKLNICKLTDIIIQVSILSAACFSNGIYSGTPKLL
ncbi:unnamed protein product [Urochloa humidicola]